jgi:hypothetical protein
MPTFMKPIDAIEIKGTFRIKAGILERRLKRIGWRTVPQHPDVHGYCTIWYKNKIYRYHRIVWVLINGKDIPVGLEIDHIDGDCMNNNINNLRAVTLRENQTNQKIHRQGRLPGCCFSKVEQKWQAQIQTNRKQKFLGYFKTETEAHKAYIQAITK